MADLEQLRRIHIFSSLPDGILSEIARLGGIDTYEAGEVIFYQGDRARYLYGILDGRVDLGLQLRDKVVDFDVVYEESIVEKSEVREKHIIIDRIGPGEILAWSALVGQGVFSTTARCLEPTTLVSLPREKLKPLMDQDTRAGYLIMSDLAGIISQRRQKVIEKLTELWVEYFGRDKIAD